MLKQAVAIESSDECHLCGMLNANFPGPKGELADKCSEQVNKFCSTRDMFAFYLQPENKRHITQLLVHDMSKMPWDEPNDGQEAQANAFQKEFGGMVHRFEDITVDRL